MADAVADAKNSVAAFKHTENLSVVRDLGVLRLNYLWCGPKYEETCWKGDVVEKLLESVTLSLKIYLG